MRWEAILKYPFIFLTGFLITFLLTPALRRLGNRLGMMDQPDARRIHKVAIPRSGGLAVFLGFHAACAMVFLQPWIPLEGELSALWWWQFLVLSALMVALGIADDLRSLRPAVKLAGQIIIALMAYAWDMRVGKVLGLDLPLALDVLATVLWFLIIINAFNLIDGLDGLATGLAIIAAIGLAGSFAFRHLPRDTLVILGLIGSCAAFLRYNFSPATIFLGDGGSMFLGFTLAAVALSTFSKSHAATAIIVPLLAMGIPLLDTLLAIWRRTARRFRTRLAAPHAADAEPDHIFQGDTDHLHHRLVRTGLSHRATATALYALNGALVAVGLLSIIFRSRAVGIYTLAFVAGTYVVVRYLAGTELWVSGVAVTEGIRRPFNRALAVVLAPAWDVLALCLALAVATVAGLHKAVGIELSRFWFNQIPIWVGVPFLLLAVTRTYQRIWSRARPTEYVLLGFTLLAGILAAAGFAIVAAQPPPPLSVMVLNLDDPGDPSIVMGQGAGNWLLWQVLVYIGCAVPLVLGTRLLPRVIQDAVGLAGSRRHRADGSAHHVLLYGAGFSTSLYLMDRSFTPAGEQEGQKILGLLDDDPLLNGRYVGGYRVLGGIAHLPDLIAARRIDEIVLTTPLRPDVQARLLRLAAEHRITIRAWHLLTNPIYVPPGS